jgi:hypothetical protein
MLRHAVTLTFLAHVATGCFAPNYDGIVYKCSAEKPACPEGHQCTDGLCLPITPDMQSSDAGVTPDLASPVGCRSGQGSRVGLAWACSGKFSSAANQCADGWQPCTSATGVDLAVCNMLPGFFIADRPGSHDQLVDFSGTSCLAAEMFRPYRLFFGCGRGTETVDVTNECAGFKRAQRCATIWDCGASTHELRFVAYPGTDSGVLCCR